MRNLCSSSQQTEKLFPDGRKEVRFPDGTVKRVQPGGEEESVFPDGTVQRLLANGDMVIEYTNGQRECHTADYKVATCLMNYSCRIPTLAHEHSWYLTTEAALPRWYDEDSLPRWPARDKVCLWPAEGQGQRRTCASGHLAAAAAAAAGLSFLDTHTHIPPLFCTP